MASYIFRLLAKAKRSVGVDFGTYHFKGSTAVVAATSFSCFCLAAIVECLRFLLIPDFEDTKSTMESSCCAANPYKLGQFI